MAIVNKVSATIVLCPNELLNSINSDATIIPVCNAIRVDDGVNLTLTFSTALSAGEDTQLDFLIANYVCTESMVDSPAELSDLVGTIFPMNFLYSSHAKNKWLSFEAGKNISSNETHAVLPFDCKLISITFTNEHDDVNSDVEIHNSPFGSVNTDNIVLTWPLRALRTSRKSNFVTSTTFAAGDKLGIYCKKVSGSNDPEHVVVVMYLQITNIVEDETLENFSGEF